MCRWQIWVRSHFGQCGLGPLWLIPEWKWWCRVGLLQCLPSLPWCSSYPVLSTPEGYLISSVTSVIWSSPAGSRGRRAVLARQVQGEGRRKNSMFFESLHVCLKWFTVSTLINESTRLIHWNIRIKKIDENDRRKGYKNRQEKKKEENHTPLHVTYSFQSDCRFGKEMCVK